MNDLRGQNVLVMGLKRSGLSAIRLLASAGARVTGTDIDPALEVPEQFPGEHRVVLRLGKHDPEDFLHADLIVVSPGVPTAHPLLNQARNRGVPVIGELELASRFLGQEVVYGITGTNGKSTTTELLAEIVRRSGKRVFAGGNLGTPVSDAIVNAPEKGWEALVLEISSFQLETIESFRPHVGVILNITPDHAERHEGSLAYAEAKFALFRNQLPSDYALLNRDDEEIRRYRPKMVSKQVWFSQQDKEFSSFRIENGELLYQPGGKPIRIADLKSAQLTGSHNRENILAAAAMAFLTGISPECIQTGIDAFRGLAHRMEKVRELRGVTYIDDSKATNIGAVLRSLESTAAPVVLIAGGREKGGGFGPLRAFVKEKVKALILIGESKERFKSDLEGATRIEFAISLEDAVRKASRVAGNGDTVLLSPACSSFDMFRDYAERGNRFKKAVLELG